MQRCHKPLFKKIEIVLRNLSSPCLSHRRGGGPTAKSLFLLPMASSSRLWFHVRALISPALRRRWRRRTACMRAGVHIQILMLHSPITKSISNNFLNIMIPFWTVVGMETFPSNSNRALNINNSSQQAHPPGSKKSINQRRKSFIKTHWIGEQRALRLRLPADWSELRASRTTSEAKCGKEWSFQPHQLLSRMKHSIRVPLLPSVRRCGNSIWRGS